ncbi:MAG: restriction endonuclease subunit S [Bacteroidetes bacterium]|nr:restriction endonuclease subunit S [Bacteroidota bacterium]
MSEWKEYKIKDLGTVITGTTPSSKFPEDFGNEVMFVTPSDYKNYTKNINQTERYLSQIGVKKLSNRVLPINSIMVTCIGSDMGKVALNLLKVITNQQINSIIPNSIVDNNFLYYKIKDEYDTLKMYGGEGTAVPIVNKTTFENITLIIPENKSEQESIAEVLSSLDDKIDLLHRQNKTLEELAETLFRKNVFSSDEDSTTLSEYISVQGGYAFKSKDFLEEGGAGVVKITNISFEYIDTISTQFISSDVAATIHKKFKILPGSFLIAMTGAEIGKIGIVGMTSKDLYLNQRVGMLIDKFPNSSIIGYLFLRSPEGQDHVINTASGSAQENISTTGIESMIVPKISIEKLSELCFLLKPFFDKKISNLHQIQQLESLRDTLLPKLMSGEVRVKN